MGSSAASTTTGRNDHAMSIPRYHNASSPVELIGFSGHQLRQGCVSAGRRSCADRMEIDPHADDCQEPAE
jgi:hypothetical protein